MPRHKKSKKDSKKKLNPWIRAVVTARKELGIKGFRAVKGKLLSKARSIYASKGGKRVVRGVSKKGSKKSKRSSKR